ncbi:bifunctional DNA primase/polymerase [Cystobacter ferrugineus]|uniref:DNA primase/polymerase bifunctional N-terminal domain-containing protein n=1 Tax=Cystobacter ferrugineus TaxID=83449 RepID=A0A1L9AZX0_9BACT|nr:bifunctional DNA primase/polymerase [Cystobacter ferrugineus]OJH35567.1 hypothetical protein BON30_36435 [Cystobacter ferrugineus]
MDAAALEYAGRGWRVFPCYEPIRSSSGSLICTCSKGERCGQAGKHPRTPNGVKDATTDAARIREWWQQWPTANVAIATGSASGIDVVDADAKADGVTTLFKLADERGALPETVTARTSGGGCHVYFRHTGLVSKAGSLAPGLDTRGNGGYVIAPPSLHRTGERYTWVPGLAPSEMPLAEAPEWIRVAAQPKGSRPAPVLPVNTVNVWQPPPHDGLTEAQLWKRLRETSAPEHAAAVERMLAGGALFPREQHHDNLWAFISYLRFKAPEVSDATLLRLLSPSVVAMECAKHDARHVAGLLQRVNEQYAASLENDKHIAAALGVAGGPRPSIESSPTLGEAPEAGDWRAAPGYAIHDGQALGVFKLRAPEHVEHRFRRKWNAHSGHVEHRFRGCGTHPGGRPEDGRHSGALTVLDEPPPLPSPRRRC